MNLIFAPTPNRATPATRSLVIAGVVSMALHGSVLAAASWLWIPTTPPEAPSLIAVAMVPESMVRSTRPSQRIATSAKPDAARKKALAALRAMKQPPRTTAKRTTPTDPPKKARNPSLHPVWGKMPPVPPSPPLFRLQRTREPATRAQAKFQTPDPRVHKPVVIKATPGTAAPTAGPPLAAPGDAGGTKRAAPTPHPGATGQPRPVIGPGNPAPPYPWISRSRGEQGRVILDVAVTADGHAKAVRIKRTSGSARLDQAALAAVEKWRFSPALSGGRAVAGRIEIPIAFRLKK